MSARRTRQQLVKVVTIIVCIAILAETSPLRALSLDVAAQKQQAASVVPTQRLHPPSAILPPDDIPLIQDWNLISIPKEPPNSDPAAVFAPIVGQFDAVFAYDACNPTDPWQLYDPNAPTIANDLTAVSHTQGLWVNATVTTTLPLTGTIPTTTTIQLCTGWNLIGLPLEQARPVPAALASIDGKYSRVFGYDPTDKEDPWAAYDVNVPFWANDLQQMEPGRGYWVLATENTTLLFANDGPPPTVAITSPISTIDDLTAVTTITDVVGTVQSNLLQEWTLSYRLQGEAAFTPFFTSNLPVNNDILAQFDPTVLLNGMYEIQLTAVDYANQVATISTNIAVEGEQKIGLVRLSFIDVDVPVVGIPIQVVRTYDSRDKRQGDFGVGWTLDVETIKIQENGDIGEGWEVVNLGGIIPTFCIEPTQLHLVTVVVDNDIFRFKPAPSPRCQQLTPPQFITVGFEPVGDTQGSLQPVGNNGAILSGGFIFDDVTFNVLDFDQYQFTATEGLQLTIDQQDGLQQMQDLNGNTLTINNNGIIHSSGVGVTFQRDPQGRITQITDPRNNTLTYQYDTNGDLVQVADQANLTTTFIYQDNHYLTQIIQPDGSTVAAIDYDDDGRANQSCVSPTNCNDLAYDLTGNRETITDATGRSRIYTYDDQGNVTTITDDLGNTTTYEYDDLGNTTREIDPTGLETTFTYDSRGNVLTRVDPHPPNRPASEFTTSYTYNGRNQTTSVTFPTGAQTNYQYDSNGNITAITDENSDVLIGYTYGANGVVTSESGPLGTFTYSDHNTNGEPRLIIDPAGNTLTGQYDANGNIIAMGFNNTTSTITYDALDRPTFADYGDGVVISYTYEHDDEWRELNGSTFGHVERELNTEGQLTRAAGSDGADVLIAYDAAGRPLAETDQMGRTTNFTYDAAGRLSTVTAPSGATTTYGYDAAGRVLQQTDTFSHTVQYSYGDDGRLATLTTPLNQTWGFSNTVTTTTVTDPLGRQITTIFSPRGLPTKTIHPDGTSNETTYLLNNPLLDASDLPTSYTNEAGQTRTYTYNQAAQLTTATDLAGITTTYTYTNGNLTQITDPIGETVTRTYDVFNNPTSITYGDGNTHRYQYGPDLVPITITKPSGVTITHAYDVLDRPLTTTISSGETYTYAWNADNSLSGIGDAAGASQYTYDVNGALTGISYPNGTNIEYGRDSLSRILTSSLRLSPTSPIYTTNYAYDANGNLTTVTDPLGGTTTIAYDDADRPITRTLPNGIATIITYNDRDQITSITHQNSGGTILAAATYERQAMGEPSKITREDGSYVQLAYDNALRLTQEKYFDPTDILIEAITYQYDATGNRLVYSSTLGVSTYTYQAGYQLTAVNTLTAVNALTTTESYNYDADGRVASYTRDGTTRNLTYNYKDQLATVADLTTGTNVTYTYDAVGRRTQAQDSNGTRQFLVAPAQGDGLDSLHLITDQDSNLVASFIYAGEFPLMRLTATGPTYYLFDAMGSTIGLADNSGNAVANFHYDSFGNIRQATGAQATPTAASGGDFRFHGAWLENQTGLYHFRARDYDAHTGRFLSRDMAEPNLLEPESVHPYTFVYNNPHLYRDPTGFFTIISVNISLNIQGSLRGALTTYFKQQLIQEIRQQIFQFMIGQILNIFTAMLGASYYPDFTNGPSGAGMDFGAAIAEYFICNMFTGSMRRRLWFEPAISSSTGRASHDGYKCDQSRSVLNRSGLKNPDMIIRSGRPTTNRKNTWVTGEFKLSFATFYNAYNPTNGYNRGQKDAIMHHARNYAYPIRSVLFVSFFSGKRLHRRFLKRLAVREKVWLVMAAIR